jgi:endogenous inhibitor of DNA gyrase (YacG/DUF329 family)
MAQLSETDLAYIKSLRLYITEKCDGCGKLLNQTFRYAIAGRPEVYCSQPCRDRVQFGDRHWSRRTKPQEAVQCAYCGSPIVGKRADSGFCSSRCKQAKWRIAEKARKSAASRNTGLVLSSACGDEKSG